MGYEKPTTAFHIEISSKTNPKKKVHFWVGKENGGVLKQEIKMGKGMKWVVVKTS